LKFKSDKQRKAVMSNLNNGPSSSSIQSNESAQTNSVQKNMMMTSNPNDDYIVVDDTFYKNTTPKAVIDALEYARKNDHRVKISMGDSKYGWDWGDKIDEFGGFFAHQENGNISAIWGYDGSVPELDKSLTRLV